MCLTSNKPAMMDPWFAGGDQRLLSNIPFGVSPFKNGSMNA